MAKYLEFEPGISHDSSGCHRSFDTMQSAGIWHNHAFDIFNNIFTD